MHRTLGFIPSQTCFDLPDSSFHSKDYKIKKYSIALSTYFNGPTERCKDSLGGSLRGAGAYKEVHRHCQIPQNYPLNPKLGIWVHDQHNHYQSKHKYFTAERYFLMDNVGFRFKSNDNARANNNLAQPMVNCSENQQLWTKVMSLHETDLIQSGYQLLNMSGAIIIVRKKSHHFVFQYQCFGRYKR